MNTERAAKNNTPLILAAYIFFNAGLFLPGWIFRAGNEFAFQLNLEVAVLFAIWTLFAARLSKRSLQRFAAGFGLFYFLALVHQVYAAVLAGLYQMEANFYNDASFVLGNISFLLEAMNLPFWIYLAGAFAVVMLIALIFLGSLRTFTERPALHRVALNGLRGLGVIAALVGLLFPLKTAARQAPISSLTAEVVANIRRSRETQADIHALSMIDPGETYDYRDYSLGKTPDVFFIFVESYGSVLYQREEFSVPYLEMAARMEKQLGEEGWSAVTALSEAPAWGGGSWMSYTSALFGLSVDRQITYDALKKTYAAQAYPNLPRYFRSQGYETVWVEPINRELPAMQAAADEAFFGIDRRISFETMAYEGPMLGWGPSVPDQFTLGYIGDFVSRQPQPTFLFFLTQNLHYPWSQSIPVPDDWRALDNPALHLNTTQQTGFSWNERYLQAVGDTLNSLEGFITALEKENSVVVLIGDHQPPQVSRAEDGFGTMIHVISKDSDFLAGFFDFGFVEGLLMENPTSTMRHAGLYSLFVRNFVAQYGEYPGFLPDYLPGGIR